MIVRLVTNRWPRVDQIEQRSPWWYRHRASTIAVIYWLSFYPAYEVAYALHLPSDPFVTAFGPSHVRTVLLAGALLALAGWLLRAWGAEYLQAQVVWDRNARADRLYIAGPFRYTRNPLYLGNLFVAAAIGLFVPPAGWPVVVLAQWLFVRALVAEEERLMREQYGDTFESYLREVPRLLPRAVPVRGQSAGHSKLFRAMLSEPLSAGFVLALGVLAIFTLHAWVFALSIVAVCAILQVLTPSLDNPENC